MAENVGRTCTVCTHPQRDQINDLLARGTAHRAVAGQFSLAKSSIQRHAAAHLPAELAAAVAAERQAAAVSIVDRLNGWIGAAETILNNPRTKPNVKLGALRELFRGSKLVAQIEGELESARTITTVNVSESGEFKALVALVMRELASYPEIRARIVKALDEEGGPVQ